jgi:tetratricopeptide (TPR) repeat protein
VSLAPDGDPEIALLLLKRAEALFVAADPDALAALEAARDALLAARDRTNAAEAEALLGRLHWLRGEADQVFPHLEVAEALVENETPSRGVARVLSWSARQLMLAEDRERGLSQAREALELAERLGLDEIRVHALTTIGSAKEFLGDTSGRDDLAQAIEIARSINSPLVSGALNNLSVPFDSFDAPRTEALQREAIREAERFGDAEMLRFLRGNLVASCWWLGKWDELMEVANDLIAECESGSPHVLEGVTRLFRACVVLARGDAASALGDFDRALELARADGGSAGLVAALARSAWAYLQIGDTAQARRLLAEVTPHLRRDPFARAWILPEVAFELEETAGVRPILAALPPSPGRDAMIAVLDGRFEQAARLYGEAGIALFEAEARLRLAEQLVAEGRHTEGYVELERALAFYRPIGAQLFVERGERLLAREATG